MLYFVIYNDITLYLEVLFEVIMYICLNSSNFFFKIINLGMEAVWKVEVENFPAFIVVDNKGNDFFKEWSVE